jgi:hypothetical protein
MKYLQLPHQLHHRLRCPLRMLQPLHLLQRSCDQHRLLIRTLQLIVLARKRPANARRLNLAPLKLLPHHNLEQLKDAISDDVTTARITVPSLRNRKPYSNIDRLLFTTTTFRSAPESTSLIAIYSTQLARTLHSSRSLEHKFHRFTLQAFNPPSLRELLAESSKEGRMIRACPVTAPFSPLSLIAQQHEQHRSIV